MSEPTVDPQEYDDDNVNVAVWPVYLNTYRPRLEDPIPPDPPLPEFTDSLVGAVPLPLCRYRP